MEKKDKKKEDKKKEEIKKKEGKGVSPEEFFRKIKIDEKEMFDKILTSGVTAITEAVISKVDSVEIELKHQRIRINFK